MKRTVLSFICQYCGFRLAQLDYCPNCKHIPFKHDIDFLANAILEMDLEHDRQLKSQKDEGLKCINSGQKKSA
jgi:hypothetical protein